MSSAVDAAPSAAAPRRTLVTLAPDERALLQACVGFHAKAQQDPAIRERLYQLWCKLEPQPNTTS